MGRTLESKVSFWAGLAAIIAIPVAIIGIVIAHSDSTNISSDQSTSSTTTSPRTQRPTVIRSPPPTETLDSHSPLWEGKLRITDSGVNLGWVPPKAGPPAFATIIYHPDERQYSTNTSQPAAPWLSKDNPTYDECVTHLGTNPFSYKEANHIPYKNNLGICVRAFDGGNNIVFIRLTGPPSGDGAPAFATIWPAE